MSRRRKRAQAPAPTPVRAERADGYANVAFGIGTARDPSFYNTYQLNVVDNQSAAVLWRTNPCAAKTIELRPKHAFREGFEIVTQDPEQSKKIREALEDIPCGDTRGVVTALRRAGEYANAYGGAAIFPVILDGRDFSEPLSTDGRMRRIECLHVLEPRELQPASYYRTLLEPKFGLPRTYRITARSRGGMNQPNQLIHESRLIIFPGIQVTRDQVSVNVGFGDSRLNRVDEALQQIGLSWKGVASLMHRIEQGVLKLPDLMDKMSTDQDGSISTALLNMNRLRSLVDMMVIDKDAEYQRLGVPLTGVPDVLQMLMQYVAGCAEVPASLFWGMSPAGLNATGDSDVRGFYDDVAVEQSTVYQPRLEQLVRLYMLTNESVTGGKEPESWSLEWRPLWQPTAKETAEANDTQASADDKYITNGTLTTAIVRRNRFGSGKQSFQTTITEQDMRELEELDEAATEAQMRALEEPAAEPGAPAESAERTEPADDADAG